ncbi:MAG: zinc-binding dehydrogenase [Dehalococcoidales bacterium]|jgi:(R,R)-butanediol dehydrogenase/meso-butanediol dehydrogenase/diacetyl reductase/L-iditol 2-dehydrogenase|nr:zinc-binding dehydrogenase [Dehalococcoidales bacterium]
MTDKVKIVVVEEFGKAKLTEIPLRELGPEDIKVKIEFCAVGGADPYAVTGEIPFKLPYYIGYQASGYVAELGKEADAMGLKVGDRVTLDQHRYCGSCYNCRHGHETFCFRPGWSYVDGLMTEYAVMHQRQVFPCPDNIELEEATLTEVIGASLPAVELHPWAPGDSVMVIGAGSCGMTIMQLARLKAATKLTVVEPVAFKRKLALELGADYVIDPNTQDVVDEAMKITGGRGYDRVIEASGDSKMVPLCIDMLAQCGRIILFAIYPDHPDIVIPYDKLWFKEAGVQGVFGQSHLFPNAVNMLPRLNLRPYRGPTFPLKDFWSAFEAHATGKYMRVLVKC